jgi:hypothetical protein
MLATANWPIYYETCCMSEENRRSKDNQPPSKPINEEELAEPTGGEHKGASRAKKDQEETFQEETDREAAREAELIHKLKGRPTSQ